MIIQILAIAAAAGTAYFVAQWISSLSAHRSMTNLEKKNAELEEDRRSSDRRSPAERLRDYLARQGYVGSLTPLLLAWGFGYLLTTGLLTFFGADPRIGLVLAAPATLALSFGVLTSLQSRRRRAFNRELLNLFNRLASALESGQGTSRALESIVPTLAEPLRGEMTRVLQATVGTKPLVEAMEDLAEKWPSRGMDMFVSALEIDERTKASLAPALRQASTILQRNYDLVAEAQAELAQTRMEFYVVAAVIAALASWLIFSGDPQTRSAYLTPVGFVVLLLAVANYCWGLFRAWRLFTKIREVL